MWCGLGATGSGARGNRLGATGSRLSATWSGARGNRLRATGSRARWSAAGRRSLWGPAKSTTAADGAAGGGGWWRRRRGRTDRGEFGHGRRLRVAVLALIQHQEQHRSHLRDQADNQKREIDVGRRLYRGRQVTAGACRSGCGHGFIRSLLELRSQAPPRMRLATWSPACGLSANRPSG